MGSSKKGAGRFLDFSTDHCNMRIVVGDARHADSIFSKEKFDLLVSDLPYGVQHFTAAHSRNPLTVVGQCVESWRNCLKKGGAIVLAFNSYNPKRSALIEVFERGGLKAEQFSAEHRMSESIVRDIVIFKAAH